MARISPGAIASTIRAVAGLRLPRALPAVVALCAVAASSLAARGESYALLVGVADYEETELRPLKHTRADVLDLHALLLESGFKPENVVLMHDDLVRLVDHYNRMGGGRDARHFLPETVKIHRELALLFGRLRPDDSLVVAFAGHGVSFAKENKSYFCPADARLGDRRSLVAFDEIYAQLRACRAGRRLLLVDACQNDPQTDLARSRATVELESVTRPQSESLPEGTIALFSCRPGQKSYEHPPLGHGVFFHHVLLGWKGEADANADRRISVKELLDYAERQTSDYAARRLGVEQHPFVKSEFGGEWVLRELEGPPRVEPPRPSPIAANSILAAELPESGPLKAGAKAGEEWNANGLRMRFGWCPPGKVTLGSPAKEPGRFPIENQVPATLTGFWLGRFEVTQSQWVALMGTSLEEQQSRDTKPKLNFNTLIGDGPDVPMYHVSYDDADEFCRRFTQLERHAGRLPSGWEYRLPTEAQWEYACRAGTITRFSFGNDEKRLGDHAWNAANSGGAVHPVGGKLANAWGFHDMHGNVWEWCRDAFDPKLPSGRDPENTMGNGLRVYRGGSWFNDHNGNRSAQRYANRPDRRDSLVGFRVALVNAR